MTLSYEFFMLHLWALCLLVCVFVLLVRPSILPPARPSVPLQVKVFGRGNF